ncbi:CCR4-NOT transcription complex subunit [Trifolium repens]|nr:CCR4-NOT transcription complex subunit [Trifolium repens]
MANDALFVAPLRASTQSSTIAHKIANMEHFVIELRKPDLRENAIHELSKMKELSQELALLLWNSFGTIVVLLQEVIAIYPHLSPESLTSAQSTRVCNVLALLTCVASHPDTKMPFLNANIPLYLYPFLDTTNKLPHFENLRLSSLGVIGALVKVSTKEVIGFFLASEIIPLCLRNMEIGKELTKTVATLILEKILLDDDGLACVCARPERFLAVGRVLDRVLENLEYQPSNRLLKHLIPCYSRLSQNRWAGNALRTSLPNVFGKPTFINSLREDPATWMWAQQLYDNVRDNQVHHG